MRSPASVVASLAWWHAKTRGVTTIPGLATRRHTTTNVGALHGYQSFAQFSVHNTERILTGGKQACESGDRRWCARELWGLLTEVSVSNT